jgi:dienelactone hydrolase
MKKFAWTMALAMLASVADAKLVKKTVEYKDDDEVFEGYFVYDDSAKTAPPLVLVTHDWLGLTDKTKARADQIAGLGYAAFAVDVFGKGIRPTQAEAPKVAGSYRSNRPHLRQHMEAGLKAALSQNGVDKNRVAVIGYCFGGTAAIELARTGAPLSAVISVHGGLDSPSPEDGKAIRASILALHGADDPTVKPADLAAFENEMRLGKVDWQLIKYGNAVHSFTDKSVGTDSSKGSAYNATADARSWEDTKDFLKEKL